MEFDNTFFGDRLASLRIKKGVSARDMSFSIGQSANYINKIEGKKSYPSMTVFFQICEYLGITPAEFFDVDIANPTKLNELVAEINALGDDTMEHLLGLVRGLRSQKDSK